MKNKDTDEVLFVVVFTLLHKEDVEKEEAQAEAAKAGTTSDDTVRSRHEGENESGPQADDVD